MKEEVHMRICVFDTAQQACKAAAAMIASQVIRKPNSVLGLATGSSPIPAYQELIRLYREGILDFSETITYNLDEYVGLTEQHPCSYHFFMQDQLFDHINIRKENTHVPDGHSEHLDETARAYDEAICAAGGIDMQLLGIGRNGHIGFNEPGSQFIYGCHVVNLSQSTIEANTRFFDSEKDVPRQAISLGIGSIMQAKTVLLIATGKDKAQAVHDSILGDVTPQVQASILRTHPEAIFFLDRDAAALL
jgi:glucosamine-6-phosphate deaminase